MIGLKNQYIFLKSDIKLIFKIIIPHLIILPIPLHIVIVLLVFSTRGPEFESRGNKIDFSVWLDTEG